MKKSLGRSAARRRHAAVRRRGVRRSLVRSVGRETRVKKERVGRTGLAAMNRGGR